MEKLNHRIGILDGFRALAICAVILFHFFCLYTIPSSAVNLYPYGNQYDYFHYGYLGVEFFFIISGFVIYFTLEATSSLRQFWVKRLIRLWPSIFIASVLIFIFFSIFQPTAEGGKIQNFIPSLTFFTPTLINPLLTKMGVVMSVNYLDGSFWSLWVEIQFYLFASLIYFSFKKKFLFYFLAITLLLVAGNLIIQNANGKNYLNLPNSVGVFYFYEKLCKGFSLLMYLPFFAIGMIFYHIFKNKGNNTLTSSWVKGALIILMVVEIYNAPHIPIKIAILLMFLLFFLFIYFPRTLIVFEAKPLRKVGESSYFLYLIHQNIGLFIIVNFGSYFLPYGFILPLLISLLFIWISVLYTYEIEKKINCWLKLKLKRLLLK